MKIPKTLTHAHRLKLLSELLKDVDIDIKHKVIDILTSVAITARNEGFELGIK